MATLQYSVAVRNAMLDAIETTIGTSAKLNIFSGSMPANCAAADTGTKLVDYDLGSDWMDAASGGIKALAAASLPLSVAAVAGAPTNAGYFRIYATDETTCGMQGDITATGGGGAMTLDNISIASGQTVDITGFAITRGNA
jgi:hypothetical protein